MLIFQTICNNCIISELKSIHDAHSLEFLMYRASIKFITFDCRSDGQVSEVAI